MIPRQDTVVILMNRLSVTVLNTCTIIVRSGGGLPSVKIIIIIMLIIITTLIMTDTINIIIEINKK